ncbi:MAG TPA: hypothetical protein VIS31_10655 [Woeseiaceae bacterium]
MTRKFLVIFAVLIAQAIPTVAESREKDLDRWVDRDLIPYVRQQLIVHPRFRNETVMFVVLRDNAPASASNALALSIRDRLLAAAVATEGVAIGWQQGRSGAAPVPGPNDCQHDDVHYYIGIELAQKLDSSYAVSLRALDLEDRNWVAGFGRTWQGQLNTSQRQAMRQPRIDDTFLGARDVPFTIAQTDLMAAFLAHKLACELHRQLAAEYVVAADGSQPGNGLDGTVELIGNNLASRQALALSGDAAQANAVLSGKAHRIDGVLHQYWVTVTPAGTDDDLAALSASAYIVLPDTQPQRPALPDAAPQAVAARLPPPLTIPNAGRDALLGPLRVTPPRSVSECSRYRCSMLQTEAMADAIVFFLEHQANHGLVRLGGMECRSRTSARIARDGESLSFPVARTSTSSRNWAAVEEWRLEPEADTFYAVAVTDAGVARQLANHMDRLPLRCGASIRQGLEAERLRDWLDDFALLSARAAEHIDWRAIEVDDVL